MKREDVDRIESELNIKVPNAYRDLVTNYPEEFYEWGADYDLSDSPDRVVEINREVRTEPFYGLKWPDRYFAIGENGCGDYYCLDLQGDFTGVIFFDHEVGQFIRKFSSLDEWWRNQLQEYLADTECEEA